MREEKVQVEKDFQKRVQKVGALVRELEAVSDPATRAATKELLQSLMELHGAGIERIMDVVFQSGETGARIIDDLGEDPLVSSLLVLYGLHPLGLEARVERKLEQIRPGLRKLGVEAKLISVIDGNVRVQAKVGSQSCGSTKRTVHSRLEEAIYDAAPDLSSLFVEGLDEPAASTFIALDKLMASAAPFLSTPTPDAVLAREDTI